MPEGGGEGGIRTRGTAKTVRRLSKPVHSATLPPLQPRRIQASRRGKGKSEILRGCSAPGVARSPPPADFTGGAASADRWWESRSRSAPRRRPDSHHSPGAIPRKRRWVCESRPGQSCGPSVSRALLRRTAIAGMGASYSSESATIGSDKSIDLILWAVETMQLCISYRSCPRIGVSRQVRLLCTCACSSLEAYQAAFARRQSGGVGAL